MNFQILFSNHGNAVHVQDVMLILKRSLEEAGHVAEFCWEPGPSGCTLVLEGFTREHVRSLQSASSDLIVVATEFITKDTFNNLQGDESSGHYGQPEYWRKRYEKFIQVAERARGVWCLSPSQLVEYRRVLAPERVHLFPHCYVPGFADVVQRCPPEKTLDFLFTGTLTQHRRRVLSALRERGHAVEHLPAQAPAYLRADFVARARISLNIRQSPTWRYPSLTRYYYCIMNRSLVVGEQCEEPSALDRYLTLAAAPEFLDACERTLAAGHHLGRADERLARFREEMPLRPWIEQLLDETFAAPSVGTREPEPASSGPATWRGAALIEEPEEDGARREGRRWISRALRRSLRRFR